MQTDGISLDNVEISYSDFRIQRNQPLRQQLAQLKERMLEGKRKSDGLRFRLGWLPEFSPAGAFKLERINEDTDEVQTVTWHESVEDVETELNNA